MIAFLETVALSRTGLKWFRRGLAFLCLLDSLLRLPEASFFLSDLGVLPRSLYFRLFESSSAWSLYLVSGWPEASWVLLVITAGIAGAQLFGRSRRLTRVFLWVLVVSVQNRNPAIVDSSDYLLRMLLFWDIFLPEESGAEERVGSPVTLGLQFHLAWLLVWLGFAFDSGHWALMSQWAPLEGSDWLPSVVRLSSLAFFLALWVPRARRGLLLLSGLGWCVMAYSLDYSLALVLGVGSLAFWDSGGSEELAEWPRAQWVLLGGVVVLSLGGSLLEPLTQGAGLWQGRRALYPPAEASVVELVARKSGGGVPLWYVSSGSSRRERLYAQAVGRDSAWAASLPRALQESEGLRDVELWLKTEGLHSDYRLGRVEVELLSPSPVTTQTRRVVRL